jgi:hypothetical protein
MAYHRVLMSQSVASFMLSSLTTFICPPETDLFHLTCITGIQNYEILSSISNSEFSCKSVTHRFPNSTFIFRSVPHRNQIHKYGTFLPIAVWLSRQLVFLMGLQHCHIQDPFLPAISTFLSQTNC